MNEMISVVQVKVYVSVSWYKYNGFPTVLISLFLCQIQNAVNPFSLTSVHQPVFFRAAAPKRVFLVIIKQENLMWACVAKVGGLSLLSDKLSDGFKISLWSSCHSFLGSKEGLGLLYSQCFSNVCKFSCTPLIKMKALCQEMALDDSEIEGGESTPETFSWSFIYLE
uniref:Uncharacterized protein n=1 Tax=Myotis myotis TaxID=51298 RepID=A0A7J7XHE2_MYOMY|nr:hypothetical protein mMyoMyo1_011629 [Myotis myotis]